jgi:hypothetical protein
VEGVVHGRRSATGSNTKVYHDRRAAITALPRGGRPDRDDEAGRVILEIDRLPVSRIETRTVTNVT